VKRTIQELAIFGGAPAFAEPLHVGRPNIGDETRLFERLRDMLDRRWLTNGGRYATELEERLAALLGVRHCVLTCNATVALEILLRALELTGEVIVPSFTFVATAHAVQWTGLTPVFCDVDPATHNLDPAQVEALVTSRTSAILGVHVWGRGCDPDALGDIARRRRLALLFDAAHGLGCTWRGRKIGTFGDAEVLSFHATKFVNAFEGGAIVTNDDGLAQRVRLMRNFGFADYDTVVSVGTNGKMSEISAAMGLTSLESMPVFVEANRRNYEHYRRALDGIPGLSLVPYDPSETLNHQYVVLEVDGASAGVGRDLLASMLRQEGVMARRYFFPACHRMEPYRTLQPDVGQRLRHTERLTERVLQLPTGTAVGPIEIDEIVALLTLMTRESEAIAKRTQRSPPVRVGAP
jgi:dTDP-4-amino-4,6-dideoxygalactose transaminase